VLNGWEEDLFTPVYKFTYFELFHGHVTSLNFLKTTIPSQMKQPALSTNTRSLGGFEMEDMIYPYLYGCANGACACSSSKPPMTGGWVTVCSCSKLATSFGQGCCFEKIQTDHMSMEQFKISKFIDKGKSVFFPSI
jgi:hypothetical protein